MCPFHGARFEIETGRVVRQPFDSKFNQDHPLLGGLQAKLFRVLSAIPAPPGAPKPSMKAEDLQTFPCRVENGEVMVALPEAPLDVATRKTTRKAPMTGPFLFDWDSWRTGQSRGAECA